MPTNWLPESINIIGKQVDSLFVLIFGISLVAFILVEFLLIFFLIKYKRTKQNQEGLAVHGNTKLEIIWTLVPALILVGLGIYSTQMTYDIQKASAADAYEIEVIGRKWSWEFKYPNGASTINKFMVPEGKDVVLKVTSVDVIHSLWIPDARLKQDAVPGRETVIPLGKLQGGKEYPVICAEYCGTAHTKMLATMTVGKEDEFNKFLADAKKASEEGPQAGEKLAMQSCLSCHSIDGSKSAGPSWKGLYGSEKKLTNGQMVKVDDEYIKESITNPGAKVPEGYSPMPPVAKFDEKQLKSITEYIKTLK